jgi:hypothetical protein
MTVAITVLNHPLIRRLRSIDLDSDEYVVFGSGPMLAHGLVQTVKDLDVVARGSALQVARAIGRPGFGAVDSAPLWSLFDGEIEVFGGWLAPHWDVDDLIARAELIEGIPFAPLQDVLRYKQLLRRRQDIPDIRLLSRWLETHPPDVRPGDVDSPP